MAVTNMDKYRKAYNNAICSNNVYVSMNTRKHFKALNMLILGATGSGKSRYYLKPNILQMNTCYVVTDPKGEILDSTGEMLRRNGYNVRVFNITPAGMAAGETDTYNPLKYCENEASIRTLIEAFMKNMQPEGAAKGGGSLDPFWDDATRMFLSACVGFLTQKPEGEDRPYAQIPEVTGGNLYTACFANLCELTRMAGNKFDPNSKEIRLMDGVVITPDKNAPQKGSKIGAIFENMRAYEAQLQGCEKEEIVKPYCLREWENFWGTPEKTATTVMTTTAVKLDAFNIEQVKNLTSSDTVHLETFGKGRDALFLIIPPANKTYNFLVSLMYTQLFDLLYSLGDAGCVGSRFMKLKNGELVRFFPKEEVDREGYLDHKVEAIKNATIEYRSPNGRAEGEDYLEGQIKSKDKKGKEVVKKVKIDNGWYEIIDTDGDLVTRRPTRELAEKYIKNLKSSYVKVPKIPEIPCHVRFLLDEFPNIGQIPEFKEKLATMRGYEISATVICQSITQLKGMYPDDYEVIDANCPFKIYLGGDENSTCEYMSKKMGSSTVRGQNNSVDSKKLSDSYNIEERALMKPEEIGRMDYSKQLVLIYGENPVMDDKYDYPSHKNYQLCRDYAEDCGLKDTDAIRFNRKALSGITRVPIVQKGEFMSAICDIKPCTMENLMAVMGVTDPDKLGETMAAGAEKCIKRHSFEDDSEATAF